jgi:hypothetical protein
MLTPGAMESYSVAMATHLGSARGTPRSSEENTGVTVDYTK